MNKTAQLNMLTEQNKGILKTSDAIAAGISRTYFLEYVKKQNMERIAQGIYLSQDAWEDSLYILQTRYQQAIFSHETALYLLGMAAREPLRYAVTVRNKYHSASLSTQQIQVYHIKSELYELGATQLMTPAGHSVRAYNAERTICDLIRNRRNVEIQDLQTALREYVRRKDKNLPLLMEYAKTFRTTKILKPYLEVLLP